MIGGAQARNLDKLGLRSRFDFLLHLPLRYEDETRAVAPQSAPPGQPVLVEAKVQRAEVAFRPRRQLVVHAEGLVLRFFNFFGSQLKQFERAAAQGLSVRAYGEVRAGWFGAEMAHPRYQLVKAGEPLPDALTPVYPTTAGLSQAVLRECVLRALDESELDDTVPTALLKKYRLPGFGESVRLLHRPPPGTDIHPLVERTHAAWQRMKFDELLAQQLSMRFAYIKRRGRRAPSLPADGPLVRAFLDRLPFRLTAAQTRAIGEVLTDLSQPHPMQRLVQGDVGSGKTVVAAVACLAAVDAGWQAAVMAPTEILSEQHWNKFQQWLAPLGVRLAWLHGGLRRPEKKAVLEALSTNAAQICVGTHALVEQGVSFARLGVAVVDEQHRFGVHQRLMLRKKTGPHVPHQLMMSATPIPRSLAMTYYADLDVSVIDELPPGRTPVATKLVSAARRREVLERIRQACAEGQQAYWVCPVIEESQEGDVQTALETFGSLQPELAPLKVGLLHGKMPSGDKAAAMAAFSSGTTQVLVCTTVIEVGVDVPNASVMIIESAERFGLAQLHQLRGRVGRGARDSTCILLYGAGLSETARERLKVVYETTDGFEVARRDLELRGPGEYLGERQSGVPLLRFADVERDATLTRAAHAAAAEFLRISPPGARKHVERWFGSRRELTDA